MKTKETPEAKGESEGMASTGASCTKCGTPREYWIENNAHGVTRNRLEYCSQDCARQADAPPDLTPHKANA